MMKRFMARLREPRYRHGRLGVMLTACFVLVCILLNVGLKALEDTNGWARDLSFNGYATTGEETQKTLDRLTEDVELYLLYQSGQEDTALLSLLRRYEVLSPRITVLPTDLSRSPGILTRFKGDTGEAVEADSVIVNCPATGNYRVLGYADFQTLGYDVDSGTFRVSGLAYEKLLTEAIVYTTQEDLPVIGILQGHNELDENALAVMISFLTGNQYIMRPVNLLSGDALSDVDAVLMACPQKDLTDGELQTLADYAEGGGHFVFLRDYTDPLTGMPNLLALLRGYGITPLDGVVAAGEADAGSYYGDVFQLTPYMEELDMTSALIAARQDILLMPYATAFETPGDATANLTTAAVLKTGPNARLCSASDESTVLRTGELSVALYAHRMFANGNVSRMFAMGGSPAFIWEYIYESTYSSEFLLAVLGELAPETRVSLDIMVPAALRPSLTVGSQTLGIVLTVVVPLLVLAAGLIVLLPRRRR